MQFNKVIWLITSNGARLAAFGPWRHSQEIFWICTAAHLNSIYLKFLTFLHDGLASHLHGWAWAGAQWLSLGFTGTSPFLHILGVIMFVLNYSWWCVVHELSCLNSVGCAKQESQWDQLSNHVFINEILYYYNTIN